MAEKRAPWIRAHAEGVLQESEERFRIMADTAPVLLRMSGPDGLCTFFNKPWLDFTGRTLEQEMGNGWSEGVHPDDLGRCLDTYRSALLFRVAQEALTNVRKHAHGRQAWIRLERTGQIVRLAVEDWGRGFVPEAVMAGGGATERGGWPACSSAWSGWGAVHGGEPAGRRHPCAGRGAAACSGRRCA